MRKKQTKSLVKKAKSSSVQIALIQNGSDPGVYSKSFEQTKKK